MQWFQFQFSAHRTHGGDARLIAHQQQAVTIKIRNLTSNRV